MEQTDNIDGWLISDVIAHLLKLAAPPAEPLPVPLRATEEIEEEPGVYLGFCDVCGHTWAFCQCDD